MESSHASCHASTSLVLSAFTGRQPSPLRAMPASHAITAFPRLTASVRLLRSGQQQGFPSHLQQSLPGGGGSVAPLSTTGLFLLLIMPPASGVPPTEFEGLLPRLPQLTGLFSSMPPVNINGSSPSSHIHRKENSLLLQKAWGREVSG